MEINWITVIAQIVNFLLLVWLLQLAEPAAVLGGLLLGLLALPAGLLPTLVDVLLALLHGPGDRAVQEVLQQPYQQQRVYYLIKFYLEN